MGGEYGHPPPPSGWCFVEAYCLWETHSVAPAWRVYDQDEVHATVLMSSPVYRVSAYREEPKCRSNSDERRRDQICVSDQGEFHTSVWGRPFLRIQPVTAYISELLLPVARLICHLNSARTSFGDRGLCEINVCSGFRVLSSV